MYWKDKLDYVNIFYNCDINMNIKIKYLTSTLATATLIFGIDYFIPKLLQTDRFKNNLLAQVY